MAMGTRKQREKQEGLWIAHTELASAPGHPFYQKLNELLEAEGFDEFVERRCAKFYAPQRSEEHTSELQSLRHLVCRLLLEKKKKHSGLMLGRLSTRRRACALRPATGG